MGAFSLSPRTSSPTAPSPRKGYRHLADFDLRGRAAGLALHAGAPKLPKSAGACPRERRSGCGCRARAPPHRLHPDLRSRGPVHLELVPLCVAICDMHHETTGSEDWRFGVAREDGGLTVRAFAGATPYRLLIDVPAGRDWDVRRASGGGGGASCMAPSGRGGRTTWTTSTPPCTIGYDLAPGRPCCRWRRHREAARHPGRRRRPCCRLRGGWGWGGAGRTGGGRGGRGRTRSSGPSCAWRPGSSSWPGPEGGAKLALRPDAAAAAVTVIAGYPWFADWGRDTMIALPGCCRQRALGGGALDPAGIRPPRRQSGCPTASRTRRPAGADTTRRRHPLARRRRPPLIDRATGDRDVRRSSPVRRDIIGARRGIRHGIKVTREGCLRTARRAAADLDGRPERGHVVTPRRGQPGGDGLALWYHALGRGRGSHPPGPVQPRRNAQLPAGAGELPARVLVGQRRLPRPTWSTAPGTRDLLPAAQPALRGGPAPRPHTAEQGGLRGGDRRAAPVTPVGLRTLAPGDPAYAAATWATPVPGRAPTTRAPSGRSSSGISADRSSGCLRRQGKAEARAWLAALRAPLWRRPGWARSARSSTGTRPTARAGRVAQAWSVAEVWGLAGHRVGHAPRSPSPTSQVPKSHVPRRGGQTVGTPAARG